MYKTYTNDCKNTNINNKHIFYIVKEEVSLSFRGSHETKVNIFCLANTGSDPSVTCKASNPFAFPTIETEHIPPS